MIVNEIQHPSACESEYSTGLIDWDVINLINKDMERGAFVLVSEMSGVVSLS